MISRAHKIKLKPNKAQAVMLSKTAGTARYAYNWALARWKELYDQGVNFLSSFCRNAEID